jgi:hypothetical protein
MTDRLMCVYVHTVSTQQISQTLTSTTTTKHGEDSPNDETVAVFILFLFFLACAFFFFNLLPSNSSCPKYKTSGLFKHYASNFFFCTFFVKMMPDGISFKKRGKKAKYI